MERIVLRHLNGTKANQVEEFPLNHFKELTIGRDPSSTVKYDPDRDDLVGRAHARIAQDESDAAQFSITDLGSRNGTFVNKQRIVGAARINPGDVIQLGPGGPEFQFDIEPRPENAVRPTRIAGDAAVSALPPTREGSFSGVAALAQSANVATASAGGTRVGKATVQRMIAETKGESRKVLLMSVGGLLLLVAVVAAALIYKSRVDAQRTEQQLAKNGQMTSEEMAKVSAGLSEVRERAAPMRPDEIAAAYSKAIVFIEMSWRLVDTEKGAQVYHQFVPNRYRDKDGKDHLLVGGQPGQPVPQMIAAYMFVNQEEIEPVLGYDPNSGEAISGGGSGTGFVISSDGFIVTNRHVAANWRVPYRAWKNPLPGVIIDPQTGAPMVNQAGQPVVFNDPSVLPRWVPSDSKQAGTKYVGQPRLEGRNDYLNVSFPDTENRKRAELKQVSDRHDVALIKIDLPQPLPKVDIFDSWDATKQGDAVVVLGYPGGSPNEEVVVGSKAAKIGEPEQQRGTLPNPTLSAGYISRILRSQDAPGKDKIFSPLGDAFQLTINSTGAGNSGGPVFDSYGRVIAIFTYGWSPGRSIDFGASAAVPIRFAKELMGIVPSR
jgi:serine protease Do